MKERLVFIFGEHGVSFEPNECLAYSFDASMIEGKPPAVAVVWPTDRKQIARLVRMATENHWDLVPRGGGTGMAGGCIPAKSSIILDLSRMDNVSGLDEKKRVVVAEPGVILDDLNLMLRDHGLAFPIKPSSHAVCTVGGMIATNAAGNNAIRFGRVSEWLEEIEVINGNGEEIILRGKEAKEFAGSEGVLGVVVSARLRLAESVQKRSVTLFRFDHMEGLMEKVRVLSGNKSLNALEFMNSRCSVLSGLEPNHLLIAEFSDDQGETRDQAEIERIWSMREGVGTNLSSKGYMFMEDPWLPDESILKFMEWLEKNGIPAFGHIGVGIIHQRFMADQKDLIVEMFKVVTDLGGRVSGEHGIGVAKKQYLGKETAERLRELRKKHDPRGVFNRGKVV
jgi:glycolate oxidase